MTAANGKKSEKYQRKAKTRKTSVGVCQESCHRNPVINIEKVEILPTHRLREFKRRNLKQEVEMIQTSRLQDEVAVCQTFRLQDEIEKILTSRHQEAAKERTLTLHLQEENDEIQITHLQELTRDKTPMLLRLALVKDKTLTHLHLDETEIAQEDHETEKVLQTAPDDDQKAPREESAHGGHQRSKENPRVQIYRHLGRHG